MNYVPLPFSTQNQNAYQLLCVNEIESPPLQQQPFANSKVITITPRVISNDWKFYSLLQRCKQMPIQYLFYHHCPERSFKN